MSDEFPFQNFTVRSEGYDQDEVAERVRELESEIVELRRSVDNASAAGGADSRLHDPEGAVTRTLAIAQETADRLLHDGQVEADRRRAEADEQAAAVVSDAEERGAQIMSDIEAQVAEVRSRGIAAARSAIQVERDRAVGELAEIRRIRDDVRAEAVELRSLLERYARQSAEASELLAAAATGPLLPGELPDYVADDVALAGVLSDDELLGPGLKAVDDADVDLAIADDPSGDDLDDDAGEAVVSDSRSGGVAETMNWSDDESPDVDADDGPLAQVISIDGDADEDGLVGASALDAAIAAPVSAEIGADEVIDLDAVDATADLGTSIETDDSDDDSGAFLAEIRGVVDEPVALAPENEPGNDSDRFLSELRGVTGAVSLDEAELDSEAADRFFDDEG